MRPTTQHAVQWQIGKRVLQRSHASSSSGLVLQSEVAPSNVASSSRRAPAYGESTGSGIASTGSIARA